MNHIVKCECGEEKDYKCPFQIGTFGCSCKNCYKKIMENIENQTNNRIREEFEKLFIPTDHKDSPFFPVIEKFAEEMWDWHIKIIDELLKSQKESLVARIEKAMPSHDAVWKELDLIKQDITYKE